MTLGSHLKQRRQELGRSLEQLAASTKIHIRILSAIEEDRYSELPARAFTRGFIVNYAKALRLNPKEILDHYHDFLEAKFSERPDRDHGHQGYAFEGRELEQNRRWMVVGGSLAAVFAIAVLLIFKPENHRRKEKHKEFEGETSAEVKKEPATTPSPVEPPPSLAQIMSFKGDDTTPQSHLDRPPPLSSLSTSSGPAIGSTPATSTPTPVPDPLHKGDGLSPEETKFKVTLTAKEDAWIRYRSDELPTGLLILRKGRTLIIRARQKLRFEAKHPEHFQVRTRSIPASDLKIARAELATDATLQEYRGQDLGGRELPEEIPPSKSP